MFGLEPWHIVLLLVVVLVFFGPKRLPEIGKSVGDTIREFRKATTDIASPPTSVPAPPPVEPAPIPTPPPPTQAMPAPAPSGQPPVPAGADRPAAPYSGEPGAPRPDAADPNPPAGTAG